MIYMWFTGIINYYKLAVEKDGDSLVNLSKGFLANRDNFCPYEQALKLQNLLR